MTPFLGQIAHDRKPTHPYLLEQLCAMLEVLLDFPFLLALKSMLSINEQHQAALISSCHLTEGLYSDSYQGRDYSTVVCFRSERSHRPE